MKLYIAVLDEAPDYMVPTIVAHAVLGAHLTFAVQDLPDYRTWLQHSFKKVVLRVNRKEFKKISELPNTYLGHENSVLNAEKCCAVVCPVEGVLLPNVLKFAKLWQPKGV
jgi:hypothetical protein